MPSDLQRLKNFARTMRHTGTFAERMLWKYLRGKQLSGVKFRRQEPVGPYILDFVSHDLCLVIEADGGQHDDNPGDIIRTRWLESQGYKVLRFWNNDILKNMEGVIITILAEIEARQKAPHPSPPPQRGEGI